LIRRAENPDDRRQKVITMTAAGQRLVGDMEAIFAERQRQIVAGLDEEEQAQFSGLLARMLAAHQQDTGEHEGCPRGTQWEQVSRAMAHDND